LLAKKVNQLFRNDHHNHLPDSTFSSQAVAEVVALKELATLFGLFDYYPYYFLGFGGGGAILDGLGVSSP
jgi:hypothetical protein